MSKLSRKVSHLFGLRRHEPRDWQRAYSQEGEDLVLLRFFENARRRQGFYVDVGAHHPTRFSNTKLFYDLGWRGISIDPRPGFAQEFMKARPGDIAIEAAVAQTPGQLTYYMFDEPALNGFDAQLSTDRHNRSDYKIIGSQAIQMSRLDSLLHSHVPVNTKIDFMSIDVEGLDLEVLMSNDWQSIRPRFVLVEIFGKWLSDILATDSAKYLAAQDYLPVSRTRHTVFFEDRHFQTAARVA
jgi:FkbM family methyltransferase